MSRFWVILGAGDLIGDLQDAIESIGDEIKQVVINQEISYLVRGKIKAPIVDLKYFKPNDNDRHIFGFLNPNKETFLKQISKFNNLTFTNLIHPTAYIPLTASLGFGNFIGARAVLASNVTLGDFNYINRAASIGHDVIIQDMNHFGPNATICGKCKIGNKNYFGASSTVIDNLSIKDGIFVGAGGLVVKDLEESGKYLGVPVKKVLY